MGSKSSIRVLVYALALAAVLTGCTGQDGDSAGSIIGGRSIGGPGQQPLPFLAVSLNSVDLFAVSNRNGEFVIPGVPNGTYTLRATKYGKRILSEPITLTPNVGTSLDLGRIGAATITLQWPTLATGSINLAGRAVTFGCDTEPCGLEGAEVVLIYANGSLARVLTDDLGNFALTSLPANPVRLFIGRDANGPGESDFVPFIADDPLQNADLFDSPGALKTIVLKRIEDLHPALGRVRLVVKDSAGNPLGGIPVNLSLQQPGTDPIDSLNRGRITDETGTADMGLVPAGEMYQLWAGNGSFFPAVTTIAVDEDAIEEVELRLNRAEGRHPLLPAPVE